MLWGNGCVARAVNRHYGNHLNGNVPQLFLNKKQCLAIVSSHAPMAKGLPIAEAKSLLQLNKMCHNHGETAEESRKR
jgi:hypothetical protein